MKVKCVGYKQNEKYFTIGKVYEWKNDSLVRDDGLCYTALVEGNDPSKWTLSKWYTFEVVSEQKIVITTDGKTASAKLYEDNKFVKEGIAKCDPRDEFDFMVGAKLAVERLHEPEKQTIPELKDGYLLEIECEGIRSVVKVYHNHEDKLCVSGEKN